MALKLLENLAWFTNAGGVLNAGKLYTYEPGTTTPKAAYTDSTGATALPNPIVLNSSGRIDAGIWLNGAYKLRVDTSADVTLFTIDNINASASSGGLTTRATATATLACTAGAALLTASGLVPANRRLLASWAKNLSAIGTSQGVSGYDLGSHGLQDRWGANIGLGSGTKTTVGSFRSSDQPVSGSAQDITVTALGGTFDGVGSIEITIEVEVGTPP